MKKCDIIYLICSDGHLGLSGKQCSSPLICNLEFLCVGQVGLELRGLLGSPSSENAGIKGARLLWERKEVDLGIAT